MHLLRIIQECGIRQHNQLVVHITGTKTGVAGVEGVEGVAGVVATVAIIPLYKLLFVSLFFLPCPTRVFRARKILACSLSSFLSFSVCLCCCLQPKIHPPTSKKDTEMPLNT